MTENEIAVTPTTTDTPVEQDFQAYKASRRAAVPVETPKEETTANESVAQAEEPVAETKPVEESEASTKKGGWQRRIEKLLKENEELKAKVESSAKPLAQDAVQPKQETKPTNNEGKPEKPRFDNFDSYEKYQDAHEEYLEKLQDWKLEQRENQRREQERQAQAAQKQQATVATWNQKLEAAKARIADFDDVLQGALADNSVPVSQAMSDVIMTSDHGPDVVYFLAKNPAEAARIAKLDPLSAAREIGKIESKISPDAVPDKPATKAVSSAPPPVKPVGSKASTVKTLDDVVDDFQAYKQLRRKQLSAR